MKSRLPVTIVAALATAGMVTAVLTVVALTIWVHLLFGPGVAFLVSARTGAVAAADLLAADGYLWAYHPVFHWTVRAVFILVGLILCMTGLIQRFGLSIHPTH